MKHKTLSFFGKLRLPELALLSITLCAVLIIAINIVAATPAGPSIVYVSNSTAATVNANRSADEKGTITVLRLTLTQQNYKWKAYVGNITGSLSLDDANTKTIYDWSLAAITGEVYVTRASSVTWASVSCVNQTVINTEQSFVGMSAAAIDSINSTFVNTVHRSFVVGTKNISNSTCRAISTYVNDANQSRTEADKFQEVLLRDDLSSNLIYTALIDNDQTAFTNTDTYDFQLIVAENESATTPVTYFFYAELG
ncbi:TPA: hypothetical protein HA235_01790 [Candidatus Woesearchaeota archaeon]|nr:hypothetical protein [Candidatus Woesearchaeota archaeon]HIH31416.1 hypothetical protein [Candidatus Woesearchaeota archaeon]HIH55181.1 hypothetical protein [Candidatus Woesearchaeota archaeon]HIJ14099.1 hypothetical protein [Candidatus Woesearchaeota archaeon]